MKSAQRILLRATQATQAMAHGAGQERRRHLDCACDVGIIGDAQAGMSCRVAGNDPVSSARQAFAPRAAPGRSGGGGCDSAGVVDADIGMKSFESPSGIDRRHSAQWERGRALSEWERRRQLDPKQQRRVP